MMVRLLPGSSGPGARRPLKPRAGLAGAPRRGPWVTFVFAPEHTAAARSSGTAGLCELTGTVGYGEPDGDTASPRCRASPVRGLPARWEPTRRGDGRQPSWHA